MQLLLGDSAEVLKTLPDNSVDALVTDPPAGIGFMGKDWDHHKGGREEWVAWLASVMSECLRVMKPGAHGLVWAIPRTSHWTGDALERAGFEVRDVVTHLFGSGFPKSLDVSKAIDKAAGAERTEFYKIPIAHPDSDCWGTPNSNSIAPGFGVAGSGKSKKDHDGHGMKIKSLAKSDSAKEWDGWGTALKPAAEFWLLVRKPLSEKTVAANVLKWGCGGLNIDGSRIEGAPRTTHKDGNKITNSQGMFTVGKPGYIPPTPTGRFPANLVLSHSSYCTDTQCDIECAIAMLDEQSGTLANSGGASRFFYCAKVSTSERNAGLSEQSNRHPTVKAQKLMRYLCKLVTPPNGIVLDPFMGSGSTGMAALSEGFEFVGIEREAEYFEIAKARIDASSSLHA